MFQKLYTRPSLLLLLNRTCINLSQRRITFHAMLLDDNISIFLYTPRHSKRIPGTLIHLNIYFYSVSMTNYLSSYRQYKLFAVFFFIDHISQTIIEYFFSQTTFPTSYRNNLSPMTLIKFFIRYNKNITFHCLSSFLVTIKCGTNHIIE